MRIFPRRLLAALLFALLASVDLLAQERVEGKIIKRIEIEGNRRIHTRQIRAAIKSRVGEAYRSDLVDQDVGRIWALEYFEDIKVRAEPEADGLRVTFTVVERYTISKIVFVGNKALSESTLLEKLDLKKGGFISPYALISARKHIIEEYTKKGYQFAEVESKREEKDGQVEITFVIAEGPKLRIKKLSFRGNEAFRSGVLGAKMQTKRRIWPIQDGVYNETTLESDLDVLRDFYRSNGWLDVEVGRELSYNDAKTQLFITVFIQEGDRYHVDRVEIKGNELFTDTELRNKLRLKTGAPFVRDDLQHDQKAIKDMYGIQGYIDAAVRVQTPLSLEPAKIHVVFNIIEGERVYVDRIDIRGNVKTEDHVIRREVTFYPGERFNTRKIEESKARIYNTQLFESYDPLGRVPPVETDIDPGPDPLHRTAVFKVHEGRTGQLSFGAGISSNVGLIGQFAITQKNFNALDFPKSFEDFFSGNAFIGGGQTLSLNAQPGSERSEYSLSFREPSAFDSPYGFGSSVFLYQRQREDYDEDRIGTTATIDRRITRHLRVGLTHSAQKIDISNVDTEWAPADVLAVQGTTDRLSLEVTAIYDTRNNYIFPTKGVKVEQSVELAGTVLGGDVNVIKGNLGAKWYHKVFDFPKWGPHVVSVGVDMGIVNSLDQDDVPIFDRYYAGGPGGAASLRGFAFRGVGPVDPIIREPIGGNTKVVTTVEYEFPIVGKVIRGVSFFDAGTVSAETGDIDHMRMSTGVGLRLTFPQLGYIPLDLDWGFPLKSEPGDNEQLFSFNIGGGLRF